MKAHPHIDHGSAYIQISRLPFDQIIKLRNWLPQTSLIRLKTRDQIFDDCIQYSEYEYWFDFQYSANQELEFEI